MSGFIFPANFDPQEDGSLLVTFPDIPEAITDGNDLTEALTHASDCLLAALCGYVEDKRKIPRPSPPVNGQRFVSLSALVAAKLALYQEMRKSQITNVALGERLGISEAAIRRLLDLDHRSHIGQVETALGALGKRVLVEVQDAA